MADQVSLPNERHLHPPKRKLGSHHEGRDEKNRGVGRNPDSGLQKGSVRLELPSSQTEYTGTTMSILTVVLAHREAQETFDRHLPYWKAWTDKILVVTPEDSQIQTSEMQISHGKACHVGEEAVKRMRWMFRWLEGTDFNEFLVHEYDSIAFDRPPIFNDQEYESAYAIQGNWFHTEDKKDWASRSFAHPPLAFRKSGLHALVAAIGQIPDHAERGAWDRWIGLATERHGIGQYNYCGNGSSWYSANTIHEDKYPELARAVRNGARFFHGVKAESCLKVILENLK
jgi:hypothetical protein